GVGGNGRLPLIPVEDAVQTADHGGAVRRLMLDLPVETREIADKRLQLGLEPGRVITQLASGRLKPHSSLFGERELAEQIGGVLPEEAQVAIGGAVGGAGRVPLAGRDDRAANQLDPRAVGSELQPVEDAAGGEALALRDVEACQTFVVRTGPGD